MNETIGIFGDSSADPVAWLNNEIFYQKIKKWLQDGEFCAKLTEFEDPTETKEELFYNEKH